MTVLILHGVSGYAGIHWQKWLRDELVNEEYQVIMPSLPKSDHPNRKEWLHEIKTAVKDVNISELIIVGHSLGVPAALDFLEEVGGKIKAFISVSGFSDNYGSSINNFFMKEKTIDFIKVKEHVQKCFVIYADDDPHVPQHNLRLLAKDLNVDPIVIPHGGHFNSDTIYKKEFPLLLDIINSIQ